jgi:hypothetical protein
MWSLFAPAFESNVGQAPPDIDFVGRGPGYTALLSGERFRFSVRTSGGRRVPVEMRLAGSRSGARAETLQRLPGRVNYLNGASPADWTRAVPRFRTVRYGAVYPGVDLIFTGRSGELEYDFVVAPGADPARIRLAFRHGDVAIHDGSLTLHVNGKLIRHLPPVAYQLIEGERRAVEARYVVRGRHIGFSVGAYDRSLPLVIDPVISFSTYLGGSESEGIGEIAVDADGNVYVAGDTTSTDLPVRNAFQSQLKAPWDVFVAKISTDGSLIYLSYLGGNNWDHVRAMEVDHTGAVYLGGHTRSADFPTANAFQGSLQPIAEDGWVAKLSPTGAALVYSTFLGAPEGDAVHGLAVDGGGRAYVTGFTSTSLFPTKNPIMTVGDSFLARLAPDGRSLEYSTYLPRRVWSRDLAIDSIGAAYVAGTTDQGLPPAGGAQPESGGDLDAFALKVAPEGDRILYATYVGGSSGESGLAVDVDEEGSAYITGSTSSKDFPIANPARITPRKNQEAFLTKISPDGAAFEYSTYLGGGGDDVGFDVAVDSQGNAHVAGQSDSLDLPVANALDGELGGAECVTGPCPDGFVAKLDAGGSRLAYSTYLGGATGDGASAITIDRDANAVVGGWTVASDFPKVGALQTRPAGMSDGFVTRIALGDEEPPPVYRPGGAPPRPEFEPFEQLQLLAPVASVAIGDVTSDGRNDLLATTERHVPSSDDYRLLVYRQRPDGTLGAPIRRRVHYDERLLGARQLGMALADITGDRRTDVLVATNLGIDLLRQKVDGSLATASLIHTTGRPRAVIAAQISGGARRDLLVTGLNGVFVLERRQRGFQKLPLTSIRMRKVELADVTGDGRRDVVGLSGRRVYIFRKRADGTFAAPQTYSSRPAWMTTADGIATGDVTGDGRTDVVVTIGANLPRSYVNVFPQGPFGRLLAPRVHHATIDIPDPVEVRDMDGNRRADVIVAHSGQYEYAGIFQQEADGMLGPERLSPIPRSSQIAPTGLAVGDLNSDGLPDIAVSVTFGGVAVLRAKDAPQPGTSSSRSLPTWSPSTCPVLRTSVSAARPGGGTDDVATRRPGVE